MMHDSEIWKFKFDFSGIGPRDPCLGPAEAMASDSVIRVIGWRFKFATKKHFEEDCPSKSTRNVRVSVRACGNG